ncbi:hypothetical protein [Crateriforma spongiae]|uniref:hypothetical protein n=1 Tax=Crateriforma spongiae TaxID=2724528 RepID=UPI001447F6C3|nr:hypothetical protein [Crateriforma spongiae]
MNCDEQQQTRQEERDQAFRQAAAIFRRMLRTGKPIAFEDAVRGVKTPDWFDRRAFGHLTAAMHRDGEIVPAGFRISETAKHNHAIKRLWLSASVTATGATE